MQREYSKCLAKNRYLVCKESELLSCSGQRNKKVQKSLVNFIETIGITTDATEPTYKLKCLFIYLFQATIKKKSDFIIQICSSGTILLVCSSKHIQSKSLEI